MRLNVKSLRREEKKSLKQSRILRNHSKTKRPVNDAQQEKNNDVIITHSLALSHTDAHTNIQTLTLTHTHTQVKERSKLGIEREREITQFKQ